MEPISIAGLLALIYVVVNFLKYLTSIGKDPSALNSVITQFVVWVAGVLVIWLAANASITEHLEVWGRPLFSLDAASIILGGMMAGSLATAGDKVLAAIDSKRSSATPPLLNNTPTE